MIVLGLNGAPGINYWGLNVGGAAIIVGAIGWHFRGPLAWAWHHTIGWLWRRQRRRPGVARPSSPTAFSREPIPAGLRFAVLRRDGFRCAYCGRGESDGVKLHIDHLVPVARGGRSELDNLVTACQDCNLGKSASDLFGANV